MYLDSSKEGWEMSKYTINSSQGAITNTLNQLYMGKEYKVRLLSRIIPFCGFLYDE